MKMECTGAKDCGNIGCYHYEEHDDTPPGGNVTYCVGTCFNGSVCQPIDFQETEEKELVVEVVK